ncbi:MAG: divergent polysaccharide deacetylase family protein, partial [Desulfuromonadaceae bacterium]
SGLVNSASGRLAIIIDDMGGSLSEARSLAAIKVPLTFAIIPSLRVDKEVAEYAISNKIETMIHIPMQSKGWPERRLEANGLLVSMDVGELQERVSGFVKKFPGAVGVNNHMGSEFTEQEEKMATVLQILKKNDLFFIDSVTTPESAGLRVARRLGVRSARRNVFLDNEQKRSYILGQLNQAVRLAIKNGSAIAICHPHPETIATLAAALPELAGRGVCLVTASQLVN